jgi:non-ribosomal peptide synthetase component E (peptide arylation enzyme)
MAIVQAGRTFTIEDLKRTAGNLAAVLTQTVQDSGDFRVQLESWPDADLIVFGLTQEEVNAIKGFYVGDLPAIANLLQSSTWIKQLLGTGV